MDGVYTQKNELFYAFRLLAQACLGVLLGVYLSMWLAGILFAPNGPPTSLPDSLLPELISAVLSKPREKNFYLFSLFLGWMGAYFTTKRDWKFSSSFLWISLALSIPLTSFLAQQVFQQDKFLLLSLIIIALTFFVLFAYQNSSVMRRVTNSQSFLSTHKSSVFIFNWKLYSAYLVMITLLLIPTSFTEVAAHIGMQMHVASFIVVPALYFLGNHLLPGIDYFTQYSIGMGWLFSHFLGETAADTMVIYTRFLIISIWFFYAQLVCVLAWLYRSWIPAIVVSLLSLVMLFHTTMHFFDPSSSILRYPFLGITAWLLARWIKQPSSLFSFLTLACIIALAIFFNTETGIITSLAIAFAIFFTMQRLFLAFITIMILATISLLFFGLILLGIFGLASIHFEFFHYMLEPLFIYGKVGLGGFPISWKMNDLNWFYNLVAPGIALATLVLIARDSRNIETDRPRNAVLVFFTSAGLLMTAKYINMSIIGIWQVNALGLLIPLGWWGNVVIHKLKIAHLKFFSLTAASLLIIFSLYLALFTQDSRNPSQYGLQSWYYYPSFIASFFKPSLGCANFECVANQPTIKDTLLIQNHTLPHERVAVIGVYDWVYLTSAHRAPLMSFLPCVTTFTKRQLEDSLKRLENTRYLFLPKGKNHQPEIGGVLNKVLMPNFFDKYILEKESDTLEMWRRRSSA